METYEILRDLAIILLSAKICGMVARKLKAPQVAGQIIAGLLIGPCFLGLVQQSDFITKMAEIGVILVMFSAGLETDLKDLIKTGPKALAIACNGVFIPFIFGALLYFAFYGFEGVGTENFFAAMSIGAIMTATSVSITVAALQELGKLKGMVGTTILSSAIIDDVIGIVVLTFVIGFKNPDVKPSMVIIKTILFFIVAIVGGIVAYKFFKWLDNRNPHTQRIPIFGFVLCFTLAYLAEKYFGIADITGAYVAGIILCNLKDADYINNKAHISTYMIFAPIFFVGIGLKTTFDTMNTKLLFFCIAFVVVALLTKIIGCGLMAKICKFGWSDSLKIGVGMMTRGEVALIVAQKCLSVGMITSEFFTAVILLIICSSVLTPIILKLLFNKDKPVQESALQV
ncbi:MAG: cation:proton antiporter [Lachnospiraceae bacterium]|nr:cation:proton antiporter [Lachnospiraceae bacterium]